MCRQPNGPQRLVCSLVQVSACRLMENNDAHMQKVGRLPYVALVPREPLSSRHSLQSTPTRLFSRHRSCLNLSLSLNLGAMDIFASKSHVSVMLNSAIIYSWRVRYIGKVGGR